MSTLWRVLVAAALFALAAAAGRAHAEEPGFPEKAYWVCARFPTLNPTTVTVDVKTVGGAQLANNATATQQSLDAVNSDFWCLDLNTVANFAPDCSLSTYLVRFHPDGANCATSGGTPTSCVDELVQSGGLTCMSFNPNDTPIYPTTPIPSRGITATVIARGNPSYIKHEVKLDNLTVAFTYYDVFTYDPAGRVASRVRQLMPPNP